MNRDYENSLKVAANRHDIVGIHIYDIRETELPDVGLLPVVDAEGGSLKWVDTGSAAVRENYKRRFEENLTFFTNTFNKMGADTLSMATGDSYAKALRQFFKERRSF